MTVLDAIQARRAVVLTELERLCVELAAAEDEYANLTTEARRNGHRTRAVCIPPTYNRAIQMLRHGATATSVCVKLGVSYDFARRLRKDTMEKKDDS